jgi:hypothetical protein
VVLEKIAMTITAYPLTWPREFPRAKARENGKFKATLAGALKNVQESLRLFASDSGKKLDGLIISSNVTLGAQRPADPGVAVWFTWDGLSVCIAVDRYSSVEANLQAIHHIVEARRVELRHGTLALVRAAFTGFKSLPAPQGEEWWKVLDLPPNASLGNIQAAYKFLRSKHHPDKGGDPDQFNRVQRAYEQATA